MFEWAASVTGNNIFRMYRVGNSLEFLGNSCGSWDLESSGHPPIPRLEKKLPTGGTVQQALVDRATSIRGFTSLSHILLQACSNDDIASFLPLSLHFVICRWCLIIFWILFDVWCIQCINVFCIISVCFHCFHPEINAASFSRPPLGCPGAVLRKRWRDEHASAVTSLDS